MLLVTWLQLILSDPKADATSDKCVKFTDWGVPPPHLLMDFVKRFLTPSLHQNMYEAHIFLFNSALSHMVTHTIPTTQHFSLFTQPCITLVYVVYEYSILCNVSFDTGPGEKGENWS